MCPHPRMRNALALAAGVGGLLALAATSLAQTPLPPDSASRASAAPKVQDVDDRIGRLEKMNQDLMNTVRQLQDKLSTLEENQKVPAEPAGSEAGGGARLGKEEVRRLVGDYVKKREDEKKKADEEKKRQEEAEGFVVGKDLGMKAVWRNEAWLETADRAFRIHVGGRTQFDTVLTQAPANVQFGKGGIGPYQDGVDFRRGRLQVDGWIYDVFDFNCEYEFVGQSVDLDPSVTHTPSTATVSDVPTPTNLWGGANNLPYLRIIRAGNQRTPIGLDHMTSSRWIDFMERSPGYDTFINTGNNGYLPGLQWLDWTENERLTWQVGLFKNERQPFGFNVADGSNAVIARTTFLPWYQDNGANMIHLGLGAEHTGLDGGIVPFRTRPLLRNGPTPLVNTVALATLSGTNQDIINPEFFMNLGPLSIQAEYLGTWVHDVTSATTQLGTIKVPRQTFFGSSYYVQAMYFLTGEYRPYNKVPVHNAGAAPTRIIPIRSFYWVPGEGGRNLFSTGAWQVGARYSWLDMNSGPIHGGEINEVTLGLNWIWSPNMKIQWNYDLGHRTIPGGTSNGNYQSFGTRLAFDF